MIFTFSWQRTMVTSVSLLYILLNLLDKQKTIPRFSYQSLPQKSSYKLKEYKSFIDKIKAYYYNMVIIYSTKYC